MKNLKIKKALALLLALTLCMGMLSGCTVAGSGDSDSGSADSTPASEDTDAGDSESEATETQAEKIIRYALMADTPTLDPQLANSMVTMTVGSHLFEGLVRNYAGTIQPGAAESWEISDDGLVYTFHLRDSLWSDGEPVTAQDYEYGITRLMDPATASGYSFLGGILKNGNAVNSGELPIEDLGVVALDDKTVEITLAYPAEYFLGMLHMMQFYPTRADIVEEFGQSFAANADQNVYNGPFVLTDWKHDDRLILTKNENYWDADSVNLDGAEIIVVSDASTQLAMYEQGDLDFVNIPPELISLYEEDAEYYFTGANDFIKVNMDGSSVLDNKNLRLAINNAFNRDEYIAITTQNLYLANTRYVLPQVSGVNGEYGDEYPLEAFPVAGDSEIALSYLETAMEELGVTNAADIDLEFLTTDTDLSRKQAEVIQDQLQRTLGITITIRQVPYKQRLEMEASHEFELVFTGWAPDYSDPMTYLELWTSDSGYNHGSYFSDDYDAYVELARTTTDAQERMDAMFEAEKTILADGGIIPVQLRREGLLRSDKLIDMKTYFIGASYDFIYADITE